MATMVKVPLSQVTVLGILDPNTLGRQGAVVLLQLWDIVETSQFQSHKNRSESTSSEVSIKGLDPKGLTEEKKKELDEKGLVVECQIIDLEMDCKKEYNKQNNYSEQKRVWDKYEAKLKPWEK